MQKACTIDELKYFFTHAAETNEKNGLNLDLNISSKIHLKN
jgi:hypothetical protein